MLNTETLAQLLTDPELRKQIPRLLRRKIQADASSSEAIAFVSRQLIDLVRRTGSGTAAADALHGVIKDYLDFCETLVNLQLGFNNTLMEKLRTISDSPVPTPSTVTMNLLAASDAVVRMAFRIKNDRRAAITVDFETTSFVSEDGSHLVTAKVAFDPPSLELQPEQEARIEFVLELDNQFRPDTTYLATVTVRGLDAPHLLVRLRVQPRQEEGASTSLSAAEGKTAEGIAADGTIASSPRPPKPRTDAPRRAGRPKPRGGGHERG